MERRKEEKYRSLSPKRIRPVLLAALLLSIGVVARGLPLLFHEFQQVCAPHACEDAVGRLYAEQVEQLHRLGFSIQAYAAYTVTILLLAAGVHGAIALLVLWRKGQDRMALLVATMLIVMGATTVLPGELGERSGWWLPLTAVGYFSSIGLVLVFYLFPSGRFVPRWAGWLVLIFCVSEFFYYFLPDAPYSPHNAVPPLELTIWLGTLIGMVVSQIYRYRRVSTAVERQQTKWVVLGLAAALILILSFMLPALVLPELRTSAYSMGALTVVTLAQTLIPVSIGVALLRYNLWGADIIIRRTLIYTVITALLASTYFGSVILLQALFQALTGREHSPLITVFSTLAIAALFLPLRRRVQSFIDRRFYRRKYDARQTLFTFAATVRQSVDLEHLAQAVLDVVEEVVQPASASLWLREPPGGQKDCVSSRPRRTVAEDGLNEERK